MPLYIQYLRWIFIKLGPDVVPSLKKHDLEKAIEEHWWPELGPPSKVLVRYMAAMLRPPDARLGAKPRNKRQTGAKEPYR
jgi:hypothetical protein